jgi:hypothetical protein
MTSPISSSSNPWRKPKLLAQLALLSKGEKHHAAADFPAGFQRLQRLTEARGRGKKRKPSVPMAAAA